MTTLLGFFEHGKDCFEIWKRVHGDKPLNIYDEDPEAGILPPADLTGEIFFGMNNPQQRQSAAERLDVHGAAPLIDPSVVVGSNVTCGLGLVIAPNVLLFHDVHLGQHVHIHYGVNMVRTTVGDFTTISPGTTICGDVLIGEAAYIGAGATVAQCVTVGDGAIVAAGAVVPPFSNIPKNEIWAGVPAKSMGKDRSQLAVWHRYHRGDFDKRLKSDA